MSRNDSYMKFLEAFTKIQYNVALILEAKALDAEKSKCWICNHIGNETFEPHLERLKQSIGVHDQIVEVIDGLVKVENGLGRNLKLILNRQDESGGTSGGMSGLFDFGEGLGGGFGGGLK